MTSSSPTQCISVIITAHLGPQIMLAAKIRMRDGLLIGDACAHIKALEANLETRFPEIGWCFIEPDVED